MTTTDRRIFWTTLLLGLAAGAYAIAKVFGQSTPSSSLTIPSWAGWLLILPAFVAGQAHRGWMHARGIRKSHFAALVGVGAAALCLAALALSTLGGAR